MASLRGLWALSWGSALRSHGVRSVQPVLKVTSPEVNAWFFGRATKLHKHHIFNAFLSLFAQAHKSGTVFWQMGTTVSVANRRRRWLRSTRRRTASTVH
uniref:Putative secreted protein n=1 Tax=Ixodes scapularis TaxID=6945 RepID=A0A4D5RZB0_IXOSC